MTRHILKMAAVQTPKQRLATVTLINKYKALKEIDGGYSYSKKIWCGKKHSFTLVKKS